MSGARRRRALTRRIVAAAALCVWFLGFEVGPGLHLARHERLAPHTHAADGSDVPLASPPAETTPAPSPRGVRVVASARAKARVPLADAPRSHAPRSHAPPRRPYDPRHGAGSLEHRGVATLAAPVFVHVPPLEAAVPFVPPAAPIAPLATLAALAASARAPPFASV